MRASHLATTIIVSLSSIVLAASCIQASSESDREDTADNAIPEASELGDLTENNEDPAADGLSPKAIGLTTRDLCIAAADGGIPVKEAFCRSVLVPPALKRSCWARVLESRTEWIGWCWLWF